MKMESTTEGQKGVTIIDGDTILTYDPQQNVAYKITSDMTEQFKTPSEYVQDAKVNMENWKTLETTVYDGVKCRVISISAMNGQDEMKMWVREDYGIPVRVETKSANGDTVVIEYKNMKIGALPEDTFKLPSGVKIMDMNEIMNQMPQVS
jgi:outer membrane lipoprotein-sorting protein